MTAKHRRLQPIDLPLPQRTIPAQPGDPIAAPTQPPPAVGVDSPTNASAAAGLERTDQGQSGYLQLDWDAPDADTPTGYVVQFARNAGFTTDLITKTVGAATQYRLTGLKQGESWYWRIYAVRGPVWSAATTGGPVTVPIDTAAPTTPSGAAAAFQATGSVLLSATPASDGRTRRLQFVVQPQTAGGVNNGSPRTLYSTPGRTEYTLAMNRADTTGGGLSPRVQVTVQGESWAGVLSTAATVSATAAAPAGSPTVGILSGGVSGFAVAITGTPPANLDQYRVRVTKDGAAYQTLFTRSTIVPIQATTSGVYRAFVAYVDVFGQLGTEGDSGNSTQDLLSTDTLRKLFSYSDSVGNTASSLAILKDTLLTGTGIAYAATTVGGPWRWTQQDSPLIDRYHAATVAISAGANVKWYLSVSDGTTTVYYAGPLAGDGKTLTAYGVEANAQTNALTGLSLADAKKLALLPTPVDGRTVRLYHRNDSNSYTLWEMFARRLIEAEDARIEYLSALSANLGDILAGTITGALIRTAASGARIEIDAVNGLRGFNSAGVMQAQFDAADGTFKWGGGVGKAGATGMFIEAGTVADALRAYSFAIAGSYFGRLGASYSTTLAQITLISEDGTRDNSVGVEAASSSTKTSTLTLTAVYGIGILARIRLYSGPSGRGIDLSGAPVHIGSTTGGNDNELRVQDRVSAGGTPPGGAMMTSKGTGTTNSTASFATYNSNSTNTSRIYDDGSMSLAGALTQNSDARLKNVVGPLDDAQPIILGLVALWYAWKDDPDQSHLGFIAQQVAQVAPHLVIADPEDGTLRLNYIGIVPYLVRLAQQQHAQLLELATRVERLEVLCCS